MTSVKQRKKTVSSSSHKNSTGTEPSKEEKNPSPTPTKTPNASTPRVRKDVHLIPLPLMFTVLLCSGLLWTVAFRDLFRTGKVILGSMDEAMLAFTKSSLWFDDSKGWRSTHGGLSAIQPVTTDANDMGGFFVRKLAGAASLAVHSQKLIPFLIQSEDTHWKKGHYIPVLTTAILGNLALAILNLSYKDELKAAGADTWGLLMTMVLMVEAFVLFAYLLSIVTTMRRQSGRSAVVIEIPPGKSPTSMVSNILSRTVGIISFFMALIAGRDLFFPGHEMGFPPYDDIYLEWTGSFIHSPPMGSQEEREYGLESPLHVGEKFVSQYAACCVLILCFQKFVSCFWIRVGKDGSGILKCKIFWKIQAIGDLLILLVFRAFASAAKSASLDVRWHLMCLGYEACILVLYAYL